MSLRLPGTYADKIDENHTPLACLKDCLATKLKHMYLVTLKVPRLNACLTKWIKSHELLEIKLSIIDLFDLFLRNYEVFNL